MEKEIRIPIPEGMEIDRENSTFECIKFKPIEKKRWRDNEDALIEGYYTTLESTIMAYVGRNTPNNCNVYATEKQAKSALAMARISQIMANDKRFGGVVTDGEWKDAEIEKYAIIRDDSCIIKDYFYTHYHFLAFHTREQRDLFLEENEDLVKDYFMV